MPAIIQQNVQPIHHRDPSDIEEGSQIQTSAQYDWVEPRLRAELASAALGNHRAGRQERRIGIPAPGELPPVAKAIIDQHAERFKDELIEVVANRAKQSGFTQDETALAAELRRSGKARITHKEVLAIRLVDEESRLQPVGVVAIITVEVAGESHTTKDLFSLLQGPLPRLQFTAGL